MGKLTLGLKALFLVVLTSLILVLPSCAEVILYIEEGQPAPYSGYLLDEETYEKALMKSAEAEIYEQKLQLCQQALNESYKKPFFEKPKVNFLLGAALTVLLTFAVVEAVD